MQATISGRMAHQPAILAAGAALVIATTLVVAAAGAQGLRFGDKSPAAAPAPTSPQAVERALVKVRAGEHDGLTPGWATGSAAATIGSYPFPDKAAGHVGLTELATGGIASGTAPNLPVGNWGLSEVRPNGSTLSQDQIEIPAGAYAPGVPSSPVFKHVGTSDSTLSSDSPSYSELVNQRRGEKYRIPAAEEPDAYNKAGPSLR